MCPATIIVSSEPIRNLRQDFEKILHRPETRWLRFGLDLGIDIVRSMRAVPRHLLSTVIVLGKRTDSQETG